jgi:PAS domain S-box-containing protein
MGRILTFFRSLVSGSARKPDEVIKQTKDEILSRWEQRVRANVPSARGERKPALIDSMPKFIDQLIIIFAKGLPQYRPYETSTIAREHGEQRSARGYTLADLVIEYHHLRAVILEVFDEQGGLKLKHRQLLHQIIDESLLSAADEFLVLQKEADRKIIANAEALVKSQERLQLVQSAAGFGYFDWDLRSGEIHWSVEQEVMFGLSPHQFQGSYREFASRVHPDDLREVEKSIKESRDSRTTYTAEFRVVWPDTSVHWVRGQGRHFYNDKGEAIRMLGITFDITDRKRLEEQVQKDIEDLRLQRELRDRFVSTLTHDLRTPQSAAKGHADLLLRFPGRFDVTATLKRVSDALSRADHMITDLLDASRVQAGQRIPIRVEECDLVNVVKNALDDVTLIHGERFELQAPLAMPGFWSCDSIRRAVVNLADNAVKYGTPHSPVTIRVAEQDAFVSVAVHNVGSYIEPSDHGRIFEIFSRSKKTSGHGWGVGLTIVRGVAEAHQGSVKVESSPEEGTTFTIRLPRDARASARAA